MVPQATEFVRYEAAWLLAAWGDKVHEMPDRPHAKYRISSMCLQRFLHSSFPYRQSATATNSVALPQTVARSTNIHEPAARKR